MSTEPARPTDATPQTIPYPEYLLRILFTMFTPAVKLAVDMNYPLDTVKDMMTLALWQEARRKHSTINLISLVFGKSTRTVKALSARFNKGGYFESSETNTMRRIEDLLRQKSMTLDELAGRLPQTNEFDSTRTAVSALLREGRIEAAPRSVGAPVRYQVVSRHHNLFTEQDWEARVDALSEHLEVVAETVRRRMLGDEPEKAAARTFTFRARPEDMATFRDDLLEFVRTRYTQLEADAAASEDARCFALYLGTTPVEEEDER
jgi:hypothetical protein